MTRLLLDLNADLGEECGDDAAMLDVVTSANIACGGHAGGGQVLIDTMRAAASRGLTIGAHPGYPDRANFGRVSMQMSRADLRMTIVSQILNAQTAASLVGTAVSYVKPHGALYNDMVADPVLAREVLTAISIAGVGTVMGLAGSAVEQAAAEAMMGFRAEAFADRAYTPEGTLVPRSQSGAVLHDPEVVAARALRMATEGVVEAIDGTLVSVRAGSVCVHGDSPGAVEMAQAVRAALTP